MSKIGQEAAAVMYDDMGNPVQFKFKGYFDENGFYVPTKEEEAKIHESRRLAALKDYTDDELYEELDSRITSTSDADRSQARRNK